VPNRLDELIGELRARGGRVTSARRSVLAALVSAPGHPTAEELTARVQAAQPDVHLSTVYRSLDSLEQLGLVDHVHLGHGRAVYHLTDDSHQHLVCEVCGVVIEVPDSTFAELSEELRTRYGFALRPNHFAVLGRCAGCAAGVNPGLRSSG
jgi:Fe2+ or Zn2+ uptake regulation protein